MGRQELTKAMSTELGEGGDFLPTPLANEFFGLLRMKNWCRQMFRVFTMTTKTQTFPVIESGLSIYYVPEGETVTTSKMKTGSVTFTAKKLMGKTLIDAELEEDALISMVDVVRDEFAQAMAESEEQAFLQGNPSHQATIEDPEDATEDNWYMRDPRLTFEGLLVLAKKPTAAPQIDLAGGDISAATYREMMRRLGKYATDKSKLIMMTDTFQEYEIMDLPEFTGVDKYGPNTPILTGEIGRLYGVRTITCGQMPLGNAIMTRTDNPLIADRRKYKFVKVYEEDSDQIKIVPSERLDFNVKREEALVCAANGNTG